MRFAIALLTVICIASVIGTVVKQREPLNNYVNQFGPFWAELYGKLDLYTVYSAWWFLLILGFLVLSTSLCIARNTPKILVDLKSYKEGIRESALQAFHHKAIGHLPQPAEQALSDVSALLEAEGWKARAQIRDKGTMVAARKGAANKIGYLAAHGAIVLICLGGLLDGDLFVRALMWAQGKSAYQGGGLVSEVKPEHRLAADNPSFRGNLMVPEGGRAATAILSMPDGVVLQELPFDVELKKFIVEYYATGMPKLFASEIEIRDHETGKTHAATVKVNEPAHHRGVAIYQSSFDDGGSQLRVRAVPLSGSAAPFEIEGVVGGATTLSNGDEKLNLEFSGLRVINVENMAAPTPSGTDVRKVDLVASVQAHLGSGAKPRGDKTLQNLGPSFSYKLRDAAGQAREFNNYMVPVELDGQRVFLAGVRDTPAEAFRYLRIPVDEQGGMDGWLQLRQGLADAGLRERAARRYAQLATPDDKPRMGPQLQATALRALTLFAAAEPSATGTSGPDGKPLGGLPALSQFIEREVPEAERSRVSEVLLRILNGSLFELYKLVRQQAGQAVPEAGSTTQGFMTQAVLSLSDSMFYPAPVLLQLSEFKQVQASVFQVARAPGQSLVYLGAVLLTIGVFAMLYIKERRLWIWLEPVHNGGTRVRMALSCTRASPDTDTEFENLSKALLKDARAS
ncbi:cytochrome c biogenesis protein ResB [Kinneretia asaccharophila]|uniref:Cytochrome c biogenesis protein n=2 Tax=Roseateles asaccharophilus TaxID=582607 RepID=A0A4R6N8A4_9BURK|nr:cytochrome c biogenesis protein ResB [Roseateles asaccharophilus]MDN3545138.1 cytochrome c biogenesis protein ResB [Roseateles asaccharophilus]TDP11475.1 cytochrome c biogenesis protein [Roseateles asaccharophilus]